MHDYWNDPPECDEPPECCGDLMDVDELGGCKCLKCGSVIGPALDMDDSDVDWLSLDLGYGE